MSRRLLLVTADDYGLTAGVCRGILDAHHDGIVTGTSVLALGPAFDRCVRWLLDEADLDVGVHLAAVGEDPPLLGASEIPTLVDRRGRLPWSWRRFVLRWRSIDPDDLRRELRAQVERVRGAGIRPTHLDAHQHLQLVPGVAKVVAELAQELGIRVARVPRAARRTPRGVAIDALSSRTAEQFAAAGLASTEEYGGLDGAGHMVADRLAAELRRLAARPGTTVELNVHPGAPDDPDRHRYRWGYDWAGERSALTDPAIDRTVRELGFRLARRAELVASTG